MKSVMLHGGNESGRFLRVENLSTRLVVTVKEFNPVDLWTADGKDKAVPVKIAKLEYLFSYFDGVYYHYHFNRKLYYD